MMDIYDRLGVKKIVNAQGNVTRIGGSLMAPEVLEAMAEAGQSFVSIPELNEKIGAVIARHMRVEAAMVCSGAAGGLLLGAAACIAGSDPERIAMLPDTDGIPHEIVVQRLHRSPYNQSVRAAGAALVEVGGEKGAGEREILEAIGPNTVGILYSLLQAPGVWNVGLPLARIVDIAHRRGLPVIVDASATLPPLSNLIDVPAAGADLVTFSGGKAIEGPQGTGILCGRADLIRAAALNTNPNQSVGRSMKVGKEEMVGLLVAVERYFARDHAADQRRWKAMCESVARELQGLQGLRAEVRFWEARGVPAVWLTVDDARLGMSGADLAARLRGGDPPVSIWALYGELCIVPNTLKDGEERVVARALRKVLAREPVPAP